MGHRRMVQRKRNLTLYLVLGYGKGRVFSALYIAHIIHDNYYHV